MQGGRERGRGQCTHTKQEHNYGWELVGTGMQSTVLHMW